MIIHFSKMTILFLLLSTSAALAVEGVEINLAQGQVRHHIQADPSPVPGYCYWESEPSTTAFHVTEADGYGNMDCPHEWLAHCDSDSLVFHGTWPLMETTYVRTANYQVDLTCDVTISDYTLVKAQRIIEGNLTTSIHTLIVEYADGTEEILLDETGGLDQTQTLLLPGHYTIHLQVHAQLHLVFSGLITPYDGHVRLTFEDPGPVAVQPTAWDSLKSLYR